MMVCSFSRYFSFTVSGPQMLKHWTRGVKRYQFLFWPPQLSAQMTTFGTVSTSYKIYRWVQAILAVVLPVIAWNFLQIHSEAHGILGYGFLVLNPCKNIIMFMLFRFCAQFAICIIMVVWYTLLMCSVIDRAIAFVNRRRIKSYVLFHLFELWVRAWFGRILFTETGINFRDA